MTTAAATAGRDPLAAQRSGVPERADDVVVVIPERTSSLFVEQRTFTYHLPVGEFDVREAYSVEIACAGGIAMPHREWRPRADVCPECLAAPARPFVVLGED